MAVIVIYVSVQLGMRTIKGLLDFAPSGMVDKITKEVETLPGVLDCHNVRIRYSGPILFVDAHVVVDGSQSLEQAHDMTEVIETIIRRIVPDADVTVHPEPAKEADQIDNKTQVIVRAVEELPGVVDCHDVHVRYSGPVLFIDAHVLIDGNKSLWQVHELTDLIEKTILKTIPYATVIVHPEPITI